jgi:uncharacterized membrane protein
VLAGLLALALGPGAGLAGNGQAAPSPLYRQRCARCHGADGGGESKRKRLPEIPDFRDPEWQASRTDAQLRISILDGKRTAMPAFRDRLGEDQARELVAEVRAFGRPAGGPAGGGTAPPDPDGRADSRREGSGPPDSGARAPGKVIPWLAKFHPPAVSFPIALLVAAAVAEVLLRLTRRPLFDAAARSCVWFGALAAVPAACLGWCCGGFELRDPDWVLAAHRWLGTSAAVWALVVLVLSELGRRRGGRSAPVVPNALAGCGRVGAGHGLLRGRRGPRTQSLCLATLARPGHGGWDRSVAPADFMAAEKRPESVRFVAPFRFIRV